MTEEKETLFSSRAQIEDFKKSFIWKDIVSELKRLRYRAQLEYDIVGEPHRNDEGDMVVPTTSETLIHLGDIKGRRKAVEYFLSIPDILLQILEPSKEQSDEEVDNG